MKALILYILLGYGAVYLVAEWKGVAALSIFIVPMLSIELWHRLQ